MPSRFPLFFASGLASLLIVPGASQARDLVDLIPSLYSDGIRIPAPGHEAHFTTASSAVINEFNNQIASSIRPFPVSPSVGGVTYKFDPSTGTYQQTTSFLGPLSSERAQTVGKGKFSFGIALTGFTYDEFNGDNLGNLNVAARHQIDVIPPIDQRNGFEHDVVNINFDIDLSIRSLAFAGTYGITDRLDVGLIIPIINAQMDVDANTSLQISPLNDTPGVHAAFESEARDADDSTSGIGDIVVGAKYAWIDEPKYDLSAALRVKLETGDEDNFLGTGSSTIQPFMIGSYDINDNVVFNANAGVDFDLSDSDRSALVYSLGLYGGTGTITGAVDLLGRHELSGDNDFVDASIGVKWAPATNFIFSANIITPINDDGLRSDVIATVGFEYRN